MSALLALFASTSSFAADVYMSTTGTKTSGKSTAGDWSNSNCYPTLRTAMAAMSGGDTVTIDDGTYTGVNNSLTQAYYPPSGTAGAYSTFKARNIPGQNGVATNTPLKVIFDSGAVLSTQNYPSNNAANYCNYIKWEGVRWNAATALYINFNHWYFKQCAFQGAADGNTASFTSNAFYTLVEDCVAFGKGRYKFIFYDPYTGSNGEHNNLCRRCVGRNDWAMRNDASPLPIATFASYRARGSVFQNCVSIDSDFPEYWHDPSTELAGAFYQPIDDGAHNLTVTGSIAVNNAYSFYTGVQAATGIVLTNNFGAKLAGGLSIGNATVTKVGLYGIDSNQFTYRSPTQKAKVGSSSDVGVYGTGNTITHSVLDGTNYTLDPGETVLPDMIHRIGVDGTHKGDTGWNSDQGTLWPFPLETWIKTEMASMTQVIGGDTLPSATRGFASPTAKQLDGVSDVTLTSYIWESLGNPIPADIYGGGEASTTTASPAGGTYSGTQTVSLACSGTCSQIQYCTTASDCTPSTNYTAPLTVSATGVIRHRGGATATTYTSSYTITTPASASSRLYGPRLTGGVNIR